MSERDSRGSRLRDAAARYRQSIESAPYRASVRTAVGPRDEEDRSAESFIRWAEKRDVDVDDLDGDEGTRHLRQFAYRLAVRVAEEDISASTAHTYYNIVSGFLSSCVRDGVLDRNPALADVAREPLPNDDENRTRQHWTPEQRDELLRFVDDRAHDAIDERGSDAVEEARDRALVYLLAYSGVRAAEVLRTPDDARDGRQGLRWSRVDTGSWSVIEVYGKAQEWEDVGVPRQARSALRRLYELVGPPTDEWPVFPTRHGPTLARAVREQVGDGDQDADRVLDESDSVAAAIREQGVVPPALTTEGGRSLLKRLCHEADLDVDGDYLKPHGARRGVGDQLYREDRGLAMDVLRHRTLSTTRESYSHIEAEETGEKASDVFDS